MFKTKVKAYSLLVVNKKKIGKKIKVLSVLANSNKSEENYILYTTLLCIITTQFTHIVTLHFTNLYVLLTTSATNSLTY